MVIKNIFQSLSRLGLLLRYYWRAHTRFNVHSPFLSDLISTTLEDRRNYYAFPLLEEFREHLRHDDREVRISDWGAGSQVNSRSLRKVRDIARNSLVTPSTGKLLFRLTKRFRPRNILELGTSLGLSTLYMATAAPGSEVVTVEGCPETAALAEEHFRMYGAPNIELQNGRFEHLLPAILERWKQLDFLFIDGDHRRQPTLQNLEQCLPYAGNDSLFVIADIQWSREMAQAWNAIRRHPRVRLSVELYHLGLLFFREEYRERRNITLIPYPWKPWRIGLFG